MSKPARIKNFESMARDLVGDGKAPNLFFVTDRGVVVTITRDFGVAYQAWRSVSAWMDRETALEDRRYGLICSIEPKLETEPTLVRRDDVQVFLRHFPCYRKQYVDSWDR